MIQRLKSLRPLDAVIIGVAAVVLILGGFLGYSVWAQSRSAKAAAPVSRAVQELERSVKRKPKDVNLRMELAQAYTVQGDDGKAAEQYKQVLSSNKDYLPALQGIGFVAARQKQWDRAEGYLRRALKIMEGQPSAKMSKSYETANFYMATALFEQQKYEDAVGYFKEALRVNNSASDTHYLLAATYRKMDAIDEAKQELEFALAFDPVMPEANYDLGLILQSEGDLAGAAQHFRIAADKAPNRDEPRVALEKLGPYSKRIEAAKALMKTKPKEALKEARIAIALEPRNEDGLVVLAQLYEKTGDKAAASDTYKNVLSVYPQNKAAKAALERLTNDK